MSRYLYALYTLINLAILFWGLVLWLRSRRTSILIITLISFGLVYDNFILTLGSLLSGGPVLYALSLPRFALHQLVLPWLIWAAFDQARRAGHAWTSGKQTAGVILVLCLLVVGLGVATRLIPLDLHLETMDGVTRYFNRGSSGPPIVSIVSIGFAGVMGWFFWRKNGWPWLFLTAVLVFLGEGIPVEMIRRVLGSGAEVLFMTALLLTEQRAASWGKKVPPEGNIPRVQAG